METTVRAVVDVLRRTPARPVVVVGEDQLDRPVRWVHTSEIYDIAALLSGGEMLLTSGLGLVGTDAAEQRSYVRSLADRGVAALAVEVGRTFPTVPEALVDAAREVGLILVVLHGTTPFIRIIETVHRNLLDAENAALRRRTQVADGLMETLLGGSGLAALLGRAEQILDVDLVLVGVDGRVLVGNEQRAGTEPSARASVTLHERPWGELLVWPRSGTVATDLLDVCADAIGLEVLRTSGIADSPAQRERELVADIASSDDQGTADVRSRCAALGLVPQRGEAFLPIAFALRADKPSSRTAAALTRAARAVFARHAAARIDDDYVVLAITAVAEEQTVRRLVADFARHLESEMAAAGSGRPVAVTAGRATSDPTQLHRSVRGAREASALALRLGSTDRGLLARDLGVARLLSSVLGDDELETFVVGEIGPVLEYDAAHATELLHTLDAYLASGLSKTRAAAALGVQRQTLYRRLALISQLLGGADLERYERRSALEIAVTAWKLRHAAQSVTVVRRRRR